MTEAVTKSKRTDEFLTGFGKARLLILKRIENMTLQGDSKSIPDIMNKITVLSNDIQEMSTSLHDATLFLPPYSIKMRQEEIRGLEKALKEKEDLLIPRKKFGFKSKLQESIPNDGPQNEPESKPIPTELINSNTIPLTDGSKSYVTIEDLTRELKEFDDSQLTRNDVLVRNLVDSVIFLNGSPSTLRLANLNGTKLHCGPVFTSVFIENCTDCTLFLCCQQLRVHSSTSLDIYLRVRSRAVIEDCTKIRFGPYQWKHHKSSKLHELTQISEMLERFDCVDDFNWLAFTTPSPNWSTVPTIERIEHI